MKLLGNIQLSLDQVASAWGADDGDAFNSFADAAVHVVSIAMLILPSLSQRNVVDCDGVVLLVLFTTGAFIALSDNDLIEVL